MSYELILEAGRRNRGYWRDIWEYRELFEVLARRDISVRYKQTVVGVSWALIRPFMTMVVFTVVFGKLAKLPSDGHTPYALMVFAGMLPWTFCSSALTEAASSVVGNANLITKVYFPRMIVPVAAIMVAFVDFVVSFLILVGLMIWYQIMPQINVVFLPALIIMAFAASVGLGLWIAALNVKYRDFRYIVPFIVQLGLYISPVGFSSNIIPDELRLVYSLNPLVGIIDGFRWCLLPEGADLYLPGLVISAIMTIGVLGLGLRQFRKMETNFADLI